MRLNGNKREVQNLNEQKQESLFSEKETQNITDAVTPFHEGTDEGNEVKLFDGIGGIDAVEELKSIIEKTNRFAEYQAVKTLLSKSETTTEDNQRIIQHLEITEAEEEQPIQYTLTDKDGKGIFPLGDISAVKGRAKHGKTFFVSMVCASLLGCKDYGLTPTQDNTKVLMVDTEQHRNNVIKVRNRIKTLTNNNLNNFKVLSLRELTPIERYNALAISIREYRPSFVVVDGIADLISNSNDIEQSQEIVSLLMRLASIYNCHILNVLHLTRTGENGGMRGHLGTELLNKSSDVLEVKKDGENELFTATHTDSRNGNIAELCFRVVDGLPKDASVYKVEQAQQALMEKNKAEREKWEQVFAGVPYVTYNDLIQKIVQFGFVFDERYRDEAMNTNTAKQRYKRALQSGVIARNVDNKIYIVQR